MKMNRILCLSLIGVMGVVGAVRADNPTSGTCGNKCTWEVVGTTLKISGSGPMTNYDRSGDTTTAPWAAYYNTVTKVEIGSELTSIGDKAFRGFSSLTTVDFGNKSSIQTIGDRAFSTAGLTSITIPSSVTELKDAAFGWNSSLQSVDFGDNSQLTTIGEDAFYSNTSLESVNFGANSKLQSVGTGAFAGDAKLGTNSDPNKEGSFTIPASVETIGEQAFDAVNFDTLIFEEGSRLNPLVNPNASIGLYAFNGNIDTIIGLDQISDLVSANPILFSDVTRPFSNNHFYQTRMDPNHVTTFYCQDMNACQAFVNVMLSESVMNPNSVFKTYTYDPDKGYVFEGEYFKTMADLLSGNSYVPAMPKRIYTVQEATEALGTANKNTFSIRYR